MKNTVLFDLGGTLVQYYAKPEYPEILEQALAEVRVFLDARDLLGVSQESVWQRAQEEDHESKDHRVRPLEERLVRIFRLDGSSQPGDFKSDMCRRFLKPIFARGRRYEDTLPALGKLRSRGFKMVIVTNTPWGSPADLWREEIERHGLSDLVDAIVCCTDVGWRKPAKQIFEFALVKLRASPQQCIFVGDHPRWDAAGARAAGIEAVLIDRRGTIRDDGENPIRNLHELWGRL
jgi:HAD superfamily hydrolase (TIGR01509 family)